MARRRHLSRIAVMQTLFEREKRPDVDLLSSLKQNEEEVGQIDEDFAFELLSGILEKEQEMKKAIEEHAPDWPLSRMDPISRCLLLIGTYELLFKGDAPPAVVMNEAIDIAKEFGTEESGKFVNGVLNAIAHRGEK